jgi:hypothetical protein
VIGGGERLPGRQSVPVLFSSPALPFPGMTDAPDDLMPAAPGDLADALAFALRFDGRKRVSPRAAPAEGCRPLRARNAICAP